jgi:hypothetical protein
MEDPMSNQEMRGDSSPQSGGMRDKLGDAASQAFSQASDMARDAGAKARQAASDTASNMTDQVKQMLDRQIGTGASIGTHFASSARAAAVDLASESPMLAGLVRTFADKVENYSNGVKDRTVEELVRAASDFTRRQPALVFGLAALASFAVFRTVKSAPSVASVASPSIQPSSQGQDYGQRFNQGTR